MFASKDLLFARPSGYTISRSVRLRASATAYFSRTNTNAPTNNKIGTLSMWVKRGALTNGTGNNQYVIETGTGTGGTVTDGTNFSFYFDSTTDKLIMGQYSWAGYATTQVYRDPSAWYHIVISYNSTLASNNVSLYVNNVLQGTTSVVQNTNWAILNSGQEIDIGRHVSVNRPFDGYLTEINLIDGQALTPSSFGTTNAVTGVWQPAKYTGTYGTNGFYLNFSDNSAATAAAIGKDYSGNGNNWTPNNISVTAGSTYDSMTDVPTLNSPTAANFAVMNPLAVTAASSTITNGNLQVVTPNVGGNAFASFGIPSSGKWYFEVTPTSGTGNAYIGVSAYTVASSYLWQNSNHVFYTGGGNKSVDGSSSAYGASYTDNDVIGVACDSDAGTITFYKNNVSQGSISHTMADMFPALTDGASASGVTYQTNFGQRPFSYTPPTGFKALNTFNLPASTINNGAKYMAATTYTGTGSAQSITNTVNGVSFQPDFIWFKSRAQAYGNVLYDSVRGRSKALISESASAEDGNATSTQDLTSFNSNGFSVGTVYFNSPNNSLSNPIAWQWQAGAGTTSSNTSGTVTSTVSVNTTAGFSVVTYNQSSTFVNVGHGLGVTPSMIIFKSRTNADNWVVWHKNLTNTTTYALQLNTTTAQFSSTTLFNSTSPTSTVFTSGTGINTLNSNVVAYCWSEVAGFSKFGSYTGNGSTDGPFVYCGFRPRFVMMKRTDSTGSWFIDDSSRPGYNVNVYDLLADSSGSENSNSLTDFTSNGFKLRSNGLQVNASGGTYIYMAFAENPFSKALAR